MATFTQIRSFEKLAMLFDRMPRWRRRTNRAYFESLQPHRATHHLLMLIEDFLGIKVHGCCDYEVREGNAFDYTPPRTTSALPDLSAIEMPKPDEEPAAVQQPELLAVS